MARILTLGIIVALAVFSPGLSAGQGKTAVTLLLNFYANNEHAPFAYGVVKGLYAEARAGKRPGFTGIDDPYEPPLTPEISIPTGQEPLEASLRRVVAYLESQGLVAAPAEVLR